MAALPGVNLRTSVLTIRKTSEGASPEVLGHLCVCRRVDEVCGDDLRGLEGLETSLLSSSSQ